MTRKDHILIGSAAFLAVFLAAALESIAQRASVSSNRAAADLFEQGTAALEGGRYAEAERLLRRAVELDPSIRGANHLLGLACFKQQKVNAAITLLEKAAMEDRKDPEIPFNLGLAYSQLSDWKKARKAFQSSIQLNPSFAPAYVYLGRALHEDNFSESSLQYFRKALNVDPRIPLAHYHLGFALKGLARYEEARAELLRETEISPRYPLTYLQLGVIAEEQGQSDEAIRWLEKAVALDPRLSRGYYHLGKALLSTRRADDAARAFAKGVELDPDHLEGHFLLSRALRALGRNEEADRSFAKYRLLAERMRGTPPSVP